MQRLRKIIANPHMVTVVLAFTAYLSIFSSVEASSFSPMQVIGLVLSGLTYTVLSTLGARYFLGMEKRPVTLAYFVAIALVCLSTTLLGDLSGAFWVLMLPVIAQAVSALPMSGVILICVVAVSLLVVPLGLRSGGWLNALQNGVSYATGVLFVVVFSYIAMRAEESRNEIQRLANELSDANKKLREYAAQAEDLATTQERNRLAREIHDNLGHYFTVINMQLEAARAVFDRDHDRALEAVSKAQSLTREGLTEVRRSISALRASPIENRTLPEAIEGLLAESRAAGLITELKVLGEAHPLSPQADMTLYRVAQEGLTNVRKHALASRVDLVLDYCQPDKVRLTVTDNGTGGNPEKASAGFGLLGIRERVNLLNGSTRVQAMPGAGFTLEVELPV
jgi:signal transduction histidine kinase